MTILQSILLGFLQGVAEFLPISSSGHLQLAQSLFGLEDVPLLFDVFLHLATLFAVCIYFWQKIWALLKCFGRWVARKERPAPIDELTSPKSLSSSTKAPKIAGIETIKENSPAALLFTPPNKAPAIVEPLRLIPGNVPKPCIKPINKDCFTETPFACGVVIGDDDEATCSPSEA